MRFQFGSRWWMIVLVYLGLRSLVAHFWETKVSTTQGLKGHIAFAPPIERRVISRFCQWVFGGSDAGWHRSGIGVGDVSTQFFLTYFSHPRKDAQILTKQEIRNQICSIVLGNYPLATSHGYKLNGLNDLVVENIIEG
jgi:hypothetical protein